MSQSSGRDGRPGGGGARAEGVASLGSVLDDLPSLSARDRAQLEARLAQYQRQVAAQLHACAERLELVLEAGRMGTWEWDRISGAQAWSPELERLLGLAPGSGPYTADDFYRLVHPADLPGIRSSAERAEAEGRPSVEDTFRVIRPDGGVLWLASRTRLYRDPQGRVVRMVGVNTDVTAHRHTEEALRQSREELGLALAAAQLGTWSWDVARNAYTWDATQYAIFGVRPEQFVITLESVWAATHPDDRERLQALAANALATGEPYQAEFRILRPDGTVRWCIGGASATRDHHGQPVGMSGITYDITERKQAELNLAFLADLSQDLAQLTTVDAMMRVVGARIGAHLRLSSCAFAVVNEAADQAVITHDWHRDGRPSIVGAYRIADFVTGAFQRAARAGELVVVRDTDDDARVDAGQYAALAIRSFVSAPLIRDGQWRFMLNIYDAIPRHWREDELGLVREVTARVWASLERRHAEEALRESEARYRTLFTSIDEGFCVIEVIFDGVTPIDYRFIEVNPTFAHQTGLRNAEGRTVRELVPDLEAKWFEIYGAVALTGEPVRFVDGSDAMGRWFDVYAFRIGGEPSRRVALLFSDITERKGFEAERERMYAQEQAARVRAEEASRLKDEFLATVSHELRTPLTSFLGYAYLLQSRKRDEAYVARAVEKMLQSAKAQAQLIEDLLDISRIASGKLRLDMQPLNLAAVVHAAVDTVRPMAEAKALRLHVDLDAAVGAVSGDANRLQQVVWNLLSNAAKFTPPGGAIRVGLTPDRGYARLTVSDTGRGISPAFLPYVFDQFRQADSTSQRAHGGLGLGLAIVRRLTELHGGSVRAASDGEGRGATFTVRLPVTPRSPPALAEGAAAQGVEVAYPAEMRGLRVLVVDDQRDILELLEEVISPSGADLRLCASAREALKVMRVWRPDVLVSDIAMPGEDGYWLIRQVRALAPEEGGAIPAVALTAYVRVEDRMRVLREGFQLYVPKPVEPAELLDVLARVAQA